MSEKTATEKHEETLRAEQDKPRPAGNGTEDVHQEPVSPEGGEEKPAVAEEAGDGPVDASDERDAALAEARDKAEENWNQYLRAVAELENIRKRASRDVEQARKFALERFAADLLPVKDSLEMGLDAVADAQDKPGALLEGTEMTLKQLAQVFEKFGITEIYPKGERFDPELHEAMAAQPSTEAEPDTVLTVIQKGYLLNGRVLRAARVLVARKPDEE